MNIERDIFIAAPAERVWQIVTEPEHIAQWFGDAGASRDGDTITVSWKEYGDGQLRIVHEDAPTRFAFRWDANDPGVGDTLVEFTFTPEGDGTRLKVVESGWEGLGTSPERQVELRDGNVDGWQQGLDALERYARSVTV